jgi:hypothetical protein
MAKLKLLIELDYNEDRMYGDEPESKEWFFNEVLRGEGLLLHDNEIGDYVGSVRVLEFADGEVKKKKD